MNRQKNLLVFAVLLFLSVAVTSFFIYFFRVPDADEQAMNRLRDEGMNFFLQEEKYLTQLSLNRLDAKPQDIPATQSNWQLVNVWATWCEYCVQELRGLSTVAQHFAEKKLALNTVNYGENQDKVRDFLQKNSFRFPVFLDNSLATEQWKSDVGFGSYIAGVPQTYLISPDKKVVFAVFGRVDWAKPSIIRALDNFIVQ